MHHYRYFYYHYLYHYYNFHVTYSDYRLQTGLSFSGEINYSEVNTAFAFPSTTITGNYNNYDGNDDAIVQSSGRANGSNSNNSRQSSPNSTSSSSTAAAEAAQNT